MSCPSCLRPWFPNARVAVLLALAGCAADGGKNDLTPGTDLDSDGFLSPEDCNDTDASIFPGASERCNTVDDDCDGTVDEADAVDAATFYADLDSDTFGDPNSPLATCDMPEGYVADDTDCDDTEAAFNPAATEICDPLDVDEDCDGLVDDADESVDAATLAPWFADLDVDTFGDPNAPLATCDVPSDYVSDDTDCDDTEAAINPAATEICDPFDVDEDCDDLADDADDSVDGTTPWFADLDSDTFGDPNAPLAACNSPVGYVADDTDCDDSTSLVSPAGSEVCDGVDDDCDGMTDASSPGTCPDPSALSLSEGDGLYEIDPSGFVLYDEDTWAANDSILDALEAMLPLATLADVIASKNRDADMLTASDVPDATGFARGFGWNSGDEDVEYWWPQGITGSFDADPSGLVEGEEVVAVSWHFDDETETMDERGVRVSFADVSSTSDVEYRHVLLVAPSGTASDPQFTTVAVHAGGIAWVGDYLYVADTNYGIRVFDMTRILEVATDTDDLGCDSDGACRAFGYRYIVPQVTRYRLPDCGCSTVFSFVGYDGSSSPPSLVTGEYDSSSIEGLLVRWPLDPATGLLAGGEYTTANEAFVAQQDRVQGAASYDGEWWLSCSSQSGSDGRLYNVSTSGSTGYTWVYGPEDLAVDPGNGWLWSTTEHVGERWTFAVELGEVGG